jgi:hypothetical protein
MFKQFFKVLVADEFNYLVTTVYQDHQCGFDDIENRFL